VRTHSEKYRCREQTFFGQDLFCHPSKRCLGLNTGDFYLLPNYTQFEQEIDRAVEERENMERKRARPTENGNDGEIVEVADALLGLPSYMECELEINRAVEESNKMMTGNAVSEREKMERKKARITKEGNDGPNEIMEVAGGVPVLGRCREFEPKINRAVEENQEMVTGSAVKESGNMGRKSAMQNDGHDEIMEVPDGFPDGLITGRQQPRSQKNYIICKGKKIGKKLFHVRLKQQTHLARRVLGPQGGRWNIGKREALIYWDSSHRTEWVNESQIGKFVDQEGRGKRTRRTVKEAQFALDKRIREENAISEKNIKRKKNRVAMIPAVEKRVEKLVKVNTQGPSNGAFLWIYSVKQVMDAAEEVGKPGMLYTFIHGTKEKLAKLAMSKFVR
jgi:hypothetical protein